MRLPAKVYYSLEEVAVQWDCTVDDLLHYAEMEKLEICSYVYLGHYEVAKDVQGKNAKRVFIPSGPCHMAGLIPEQWRIMRLSGHLNTKQQHFKFLIKHPFKKPPFNEMYLNLERDFHVSQLIVTNEEKLRFEKECIPKKEIGTKFEKECIPKKEIGTKERENLLRLIGALIEIHYQGKDYRKGDGSPNANKISEKFREQLALNDFSDKGMSNKSFRKLIPEAYNLIMENKEEKTKIITIKQKPSI